MAVFAVSAAHGSPGATTVTVGLAAAWPVTAGRERMVMEADPDGGVLAGRYPELRADRTLADAVVALRHGFERRRLAENLQLLWGAVPSLVASPSAEETHAALVAGGDRLALALASSVDLDVVVDVGRLTARSPALALARRAVATLVVARPRFEDVAGLAARGRELAAVGVRPWLVSVGRGPYQPDVVAQEAGLPLFAVLPDDRSAAAILSGQAGGHRRLARSRLWRTLTEMASHLLGQATPPTPDDGEAAAADRPVSWSSSRRPGPAPWPPAVTGPAAEVRAPSMATRERQR